MLIKNSGTVEEITTAAEDIPVFQQPWFGRRTISAGAYREGALPVSLISGNYRLFTWARSYTLSYLLRIAKGMTWAR